MQVVFKDKNKGSSNRRTNLVSAIICARRINKYIERKHLRRFRIGKLGI